MARVEFSDDIVTFKCPGCGWTHRLNTDPEIRPCWSFNGNLDNPTITPSINAWREYGGNRETQRCHSFATNGRIQFLGDCTHSLKGQTVDLPEITGGGDE
ncbi:DUF6527 family protein [Hoeflea sp.]|uniref:DUF6527 family protein n=1 Tax=Hoeflea sp. TaxID=1940281 RepID=UPI0019AF5D97|nr:DUF6527 family protein [Hoeflea sp.]MBC7282630.1 hypothetical protein [Hoeflea sp.]